MLLWRRAGVWESSQPKILPELLLAAGPRAGLLTCVDLRSRHDGPARGGGPHVRCVSPAPPHAAGALQGGYLFTIVTNIRAAIGTCSAHADGQALRSERPLGIPRPSLLSKDPSSPGAGLAGWVWAQRTAETARLCRHPPCPPLSVGGLFQDIAPNLRCWAFPRAHVPVISV